MSSRRPEYFQERHASRKRFLNSVQLTAGCADCGYDTHPAALDFDHTDPSDKTGKVCQMTLGNFERLVKEIMKCDVRCSNCHRVRHYGVV